MNLCLEPTISLISFFTYQDYMYSEAIKLVEEAVNSFRAVVDNNTIYGEGFAERFYFLSYLLSRSELR